MKSFKDLEAWKKGRVLRNDISALTKTFPVEEKFKLVDQIIRASRSVTANLAEGYGRFHYQENIQFCRVSRGSLTEIQDHITVAYDEGYIDEKLAKKYDEQVEECIRIINGYINYLVKSKQEKQ
ncbi:four helix bundle protein [Roseivirga seohaensis]|uniref:S23 ribosomal protein n=2 Tax=Roseivirga seohaensis TaxID=1914963 RepID=A0A0L8AIM2_9BACT|nr:four helix bundle protein [Roseivirga seohaensis]KOF02244.1 S23 ribosomal protein [Roseivirga seohaensis subsp. aquiponti]KYG80874.1 four helix bundle protein [Roseivirga seohaensis]